MEVIAPRKAFTKEDFREKAFRDHEFLCTELFPETFYFPFGQVHKDIMDVVLSNEQFTAVIAPRKVGKTPTICFGYPMRLILYNMERFIYIVGSTDLKSERHVAKIVRTLETNEKLQYYYGKYVDRKHLRTRSGDVELMNGIRLGSCGLGTAIRGEGGDNVPPTLIIVDDPQSNKDVRTDRALTNAINWFEDEIIYSKAERWYHPVARKVFEGKVRFLGTDLHPRCLAATLCKDKRFESVRYAILQDSNGDFSLTGTSVWEAMFPTKKLKAEAEAADAEGKLHNWLQERANIPYKFSERFFDLEKVRYWNLGNNRFDIALGNPVLSLDTDIGLGGLRHANA